MANRATDALRDAALSSLDSADASVQTLHEVISRLLSERDDTQACLDLSIGREDALQQRLTAANERVAVLERALSKIKLRCDAYLESETDMPLASVEACQAKAGEALKPAVRW